MSVFLTSLLKALLWGLERWVKDAQANAALRELGAKTQANESRQKAEREEVAARETGEAARNGPDDERDLRD